jgi:hypothetical protein
MPQEVAMFRKIYVSSLLILVVLALATSVNARTYNRVASGVSGAVQTVERPTKQLPSVYVAATTDQAIFHVSGGPVEVIALVGEVTTAIAATTTNLSIVWNPTLGSNVQLGGNVAVTSDTVGTLWSLKTSLATAIQTNANGIDEGMGFSIILYEGDIELRNDASPTGSVEWSIRYKPIAPGATITVK